MIEIRLHKHNKPHKPGLYLCRSQLNERPEIAEIRKDHIGLMVIMKLTRMSLDNLHTDDCLWSDEIEVKIDES